MIAAAFEMRLSKRIYKLAESVKQGDSVADIGTDHGYVPMLLFKEGRSPRAIMSDISEGSLAKARETFTNCGLMDRVSAEDFRVGDGLDTITFASETSLMVSVAAFSIDRTFSSAPSSSSHTDLYTTGS